MLLILLAVGLPIAQLLLPMFPDNGWGLARTLALVAPPTPFGSAQVSSSSASVPSGSSSPSSPSVSSAGDWDHELLAPSSDCHGMRRIAFGCTRKPRSGSSS